MSIVLNDILLREIPQHLVAGYASGDYQIYGGVIRSVSEGRIVGHLQQTGLLETLVGQAVPLAKSISPTSVLDLVGTGVTIAQNEQIKRGIATLQSMQSMNLLLSGATLGVALAGTAITVAKLNAIDAKLDAMEGQLAKVASDVEWIRGDLVQADFARLKALSEALDDSWLMQNSGAEWRHLGRDALTLAGLFYARAMRALEGSAAERATSDAFISAYALASEIGVTARMAAEEDAAAFAASQRRAEALLDYGARIRVPYRLTGQFAEALSKAPDDAAALQEASPLHTLINHYAEETAAAQARESSAIGNASVLQTLAGQGISGRAWLETARGEDSTAMLFLPAG